MTSASGGSDAPVLDDDVEDAPRLEDDRPVRCAACAHVLARRDAKTRVGGAFAHVFKNPAGVDFRVITYKRAPGCRSYGEPSNVWTWFPGYAWQIALCSSCEVHVGWSFTSDDPNAFIAFIDERILEPS